MEDYKCVLLCLLLGLAVLTLLTLMYNTGSNDVQNRLPGEHDSNNTVTSSYSRRVSSKHKFHLGCEELTWVEALVKCYSLNMRLASIESQEDQDNVVDMITNSGCSLKDIWTAGSDLTGDKTFKWMTTAKPLTYKNWRAGEPTHHVIGGPEYRDVEHCLSMTAYFKYSWNDNECSNRMYFICEKDV